MCTAEQVVSRVSKLKWPFPRSWLLNGCKSRPPDHHCPPVKTTMAGDMPLLVVGVDRGCVRNLTSQRSPSEVLHSHATYSTCAPFVFRRLSLVYNSNASSLLIQGRFRSVLTHVDIKLWHRTMNRKLVITNELIGQFSLVRTLLKTICLCQFIHLHVSALSVHPPALSLSVHSPVFASVKYIHLSLSLSVHPSALPLSVHPPASASRKWRTCLSVFLWW